MSCVQADPLSNAEYLRQFHRKAVQQRVPLNGTMELTHRCNLSCVHCYVSSKTCARELRRRELSTAKLLSILDEITDAGCLHLLLTGGEPTLREDFADIYRRARTNGLVVTVFTNGTMITDEVLDVFSDLPPYQVEITLYGATAETYERITGVPGSFERCMRGVRQLIERGFNLWLKTILMTLNRHEFEDIKDIARDLGVKFRFDAVIQPRLDGDMAPTELRVPPQEAVQKELSDRDRLRRLQERYEKRDELSRSGALYQCGAGVRTFHIDPYGNLRPCLLATEPSWNLLDGDFETGWRDIIPLIRQKMPRASYPCNTCEKRALCGVCPPVSALETGAEDVPSAYGCAVTQLRFLGIQGAAAVRQDEGEPQDEGERHDAWTARRQEEAGLRKADAAGC